MSKPDVRIHEVLDYLDFTGRDHRRVGSFSKGMRQRVGIAQLRDVIVALNRDLGMTILMNTDLPSAVSKSCTSIGNLRQGELAHHRP